MKAGSFDVAAANEPEVTAKRARKVSLAKTAAIAVLAIVVLILAIYIAMSGDSDADHHDEPHHPTVPGGGKNPLSRNNKVCHSKTCIEASYGLIQNMDLTADPCNDFNAFACGSFIKNRRIPDDKGKMNTFIPISDSILERGRNLVEEPINGSDWESFKKAKYFYKACTDEEKRKELGVKPLEERLQALGGWPVVVGSRWDDSSFTWHEMQHEINKMGFSKSLLVTTYVDADARNSSWRAIYLDKLSLGMSREYLIKGFEDTDVQHYFNYMVSTATMLGADEGAAKEELEKSLKFEIELAKATLPREERRNKTRLYNPVQLGDMETLTGHPPSWTDYIRSTLLDTATLSPSERIIVRDVEYVKAMAEIISNVDKRTLANYLMWRVAKETVGYLGKTQREVKLRYDKAISGVQEEPPSWKTCVRGVGFGEWDDSSMRVAASSMYAKRYFSPEAKASMLEMIKYLRRSFKAIIEDLDWMDSKTKAKAQQKLTQMRQFIAYPEEVLDQDLVDNFHAGVNVKDTDHLGNSLRLNLWRRKYDFGLLREKKDKSFWIDHSVVPIVNAFYDPSVNGMEFPAGILQGFFFNENAPKYLNFGAIGSVIGHEITHGFDDQGRQNNYQGDLENWWEPETAKRFLERTKCVIDQYSGFEAKQVGLNLNGITTQGENIADNGGIKEAYKAYGLWLDENSEESSLPGLDLTPRQLFWVSWSQSWCNKWRDAALKKQVKTGAHSPGEFRIVGPLSNNKDFAKDYNCPVGSVMNPENKCQVW